MTAKRIWLLTQDGTEYLACEDEQGLFSFFGSANKYTRKTLEVSGFKFAYHVDLSRMRSFLKGYGNA